MNDTTDADFESVEADLRRRSERLARYLKIRAGVGVVLMILGAVGYGGAIVVAGVPLGLWNIPSIAAWTHGFGAILAVFLPAAFGFIATRAGWGYWKHRHLEDPDPGCLVA